MKFWRIGTQLCLCKRMDEIWEASRFCLIWILQEIEVAVVEVESGFGTWRALRNILVCSASNWRLLNLEVILSNST